MTTATRSIRRIADQAVDQALGRAFRKILKASAAEHPHTRTGTIADAYARAVRREAARVG